jgi:hypothetical protein
MRLCTVSLLVLVALGADVRPAPAQSSLVACGWDEVYVLEVARVPRKTWRWKAADRPELPVAYRDLFRTTDDCKPVEGNRLLITASSDGAALVDRATGVATWWGRCGNAHSAELLPGDRIALACSVREGTGDKLVLFDARIPETELFATPLPSGHGVVWDAGRERLWALGFGELRAYRLRDWDTARPSLELDARYPLPDEGGHELSPVPGTSHLVVSTHEGVWRFDRDARAFTPDPVLQGLHDVKSVTIHPGTGQVAFTQADRPEWWTRTIRFRHPHADLTLESERIYKVRWDR